MLPVMHKIDRVCVRDLAEDCICDQSLVQPCEVSLIWTGFWKDIGR